MYEECAPQLRHTQKVNAAGDWPRHWVCTGRLHAVRKQTRKIGFASEKSSQKLPVPCHVKPLHQIPLHVPGSNPAIKFVDKLSTSMQQQMHLMCRLINCFFARYSIGKNAF